MKTPQHGSLAVIVIAAMLLNHFPSSLQAHGGSAKIPAAIEAAPVLKDIEKTDLVYMKGDGRVQITKTLTVSDDDSRYLYSASVRISSGFNSSEDVLLFKNQSNISGSWNEKNGILSLSGRSSVANYQTALRSIEYENTNTINPSTVKRTVSFTVSEIWLSSNTVSRNIVINSPNSPPVLGNIEITALDYCITSGEAYLTTSLTITDPDNLTLSAAKVHIATGYSPGEDLLLFTDQNGITGSWDPSAGILSLSGISLKANYQLALRSIRYVNTNAIDPTEGIREVAFSVTDELDMSNVVFRSIMVYGRVNAVISGSTTLCFDDNASVPIQIAFTGTAPWKISISRDGNNELEYKEISDNPFVIYVKKEGTYRISFVSDTYCNGDTIGSGYARIAFNTPPTAILSGSDSICEGSLASLQVMLTGTPPWRYSYRKNTNNPIEVANVFSSPNILGVQQAGTYTLVEVYDKHCQGLVSGSATIFIKPAPAVMLSGLEPSYNRDSTEWISLIGTPSGGTFSGPGVIQYNSQWFFVTSLPPIGTHHIIYAYRASPATCFGYDTATVKILEADAVIEFENDRINYCLNDPPFLVTGTNLVGDIGTFTISGGKGLVDHGDNTATVYPAELVTNKYTLTYSYTDDGALLRKFSDFYTGNAPKADFTWATECYQAGQPVLLKDVSVSTFGYLIDTLFSWKITGNSTVFVDTARNITYTFPRPGNYTIELQLLNSFGCYKDTLKTLVLKPTWNFEEEIFTEDFETGAVGWQREKSPGFTVNSWTLGIPGEAFNDAETSTCWYTSINVARPPREQSWISSPCFDFTGIERPMLKMKVWRLFNANRDGANIQFSADSGKNWIPLGDVDDGISWYNSHNIPGLVGDYKTGWCYIQETGLGNDTKWKEVRHSLDMLKGKPLVQFRIAYGSDGSAQNNEGFAFDNFWIGERNRKAIIEHFTNSTLATCDTADSKLDEFIADNELSVIDVQYHTGNPSGDPFFEDNTVIPPLREFYYGLSGVPYALLNGGTTSLHRFDYIKNSKPFNKNTALVESLRDSKFSLTLSSHFNNNNGIEVSAVIKALTDVPMTEITLHVAVVEREIVNITGINGDTLFRNVIKAMLPDAAGKTFPTKIWPVDEYSKVDLVWNIQHVYDQQQLRLVAFIQDESTKEIYQAAILDTIGNPTGIIDYPLPGSPREKSFIVYPNPADRMAFVKFEHETEEEFTIELYNNVGRLAFSTRLPAGTERTEIPTEEFPDGLYLLRLISNDKLTGTSKFTISK
jgi:hypothetical protein